MSLCIVASNRCSPLWDSLNVNKIRCLTTYLHFIKFNVEEVEVFEDLELLVSATVVVHFHFPFGNNKFDIYTSALLGAKPVIRRIFVKIFLW